MKSPKHNGSASLIVLALALTCASLASAKIIYVDVDASGNNSGTSWADAFPNLQDALAFSLAGDELRIAEGYYRPDIGAGITPGDREASFVLKSGLLIKGGYAGAGELKPTSRRIDEYVTHLTGDLLGNDIPLVLTSYRDNMKWMDEPSRQDNSIHVVTAKFVDNSCELDGLTICSGHANGNLYEDRRGAGFDISGASHKLYGPTLSNCILRDHVARDRGASVYANTASTVIQGCLFENNFSENPAPGVYLAAGEMIVTDCRFIANAVSHHNECGAFYNLGGKATITNTLFSENYGGRQAGAILNDRGTLSAIACTFTHNYALYDGGALGNYFEGVLLAKDCIFVGNMSAGDGGAIYNETSPCDLQNCLFNGNIAHHGGGAIATFGAPMLLTNCTFTANTAETGNALLCDEKDSIEGHVEINNCILANNGDEVERQGKARVTASYSWMSDDGGVVGFNGIIVGDDPGFIDPNGPDGIAGTIDDDLRLHETSPCINAASNPDLPIDLITDLDGKPRRIEAPDVPDTGRGEPPIVDMGAYEFEPYVPGPSRPVAQAGPVQFVYAWLDGIADVVLDGSGSFDPDPDDRLWYTWTWSIGNQRFSAQGVHPLIHLPIGVHTITLGVTDGAHLSTPDTTTVTVFGPFESKLTIQPNIIHRQDIRVEFISIIAELFEIELADVNLAQDLIVLPGDVAPVYQSAFDYEIGDSMITQVLAVYDKETLLSVIPGNGGTTITAAGMLTSGQAYEGTGMVDISGEISNNTDVPLPDPLEWAAAEEERVDDPQNPNDPNRIFLLSGQPYALLIDPRVDDGQGVAGWAIAMRPVVAIDPLNGNIEYEFDCFEDNNLDRSWSSERVHITPYIDRSRLMNLTFRVRARNSAGGIGDWSNWDWVKFVNDEADAFRLYIPDWPTPPQPPLPNPNAPLPNPSMWAPAEPNMITDPNDPNQAIYLLPGTPQSLLLDPNADDGQGLGGWAITMRALESVNPSGGPVEYQFDCFEDNRFDTDWSPLRTYTTTTMPREELAKFTFRTRTRNAQGDISLWSRWEWIRNLP